MAGSTAFATMYDHYFTGDALADFGLRPEDLIMSGVREDLDDASSARSSSTQSTVVVSNLHPPTKASSSSSKAKSLNLSVADGTILSSLDDDDDTGVTEALHGMLLPRILLCVSLSLICMSVLGGVMVWKMFPSAGSDSGMGYSSYDGIEPLDSSVPSPFTPSGGGRTTGDLFSETDTGRPDCPSPSQPTLPLPGKKGIVLGLDNSDIQILQKISSLKPHWTYSMSQLRPNSQPPLVEFVPMVPISTNDLSAMQYNSEQHKRVLGFYEPDASGLTALSVDAAVDQWFLLEDFHLPLISPSTVDSTGPWMREFMEQVDEKCLRVDWVGVHWFGEPSFPEFKTSLQQIYNMYGRRPVLLTEFAIVDGEREQGDEISGFSQTDVLEFMKQAIPWLEEQEWVAGYTWYEFDSDHPTGGSSALFDASGALTDVGAYYSSVTKENPVGNQ